jgi:uncharacterized membrane protein
MNWHQKHQQTMTRSGGIAEWVARRIGSMPSIVAHTLAFIACFEAVALGEIDLQAMLLWLTTIVSLEAIYIGLFLQNSSNRHGDASEHQAEADYATNIAAKQDIEKLIQSLARIETDKLDKILAALTPQKPRKKAKPLKPRKHGA